MSKHLLRLAAASLKPIRQRTQYSCMSASMSMCLNALGFTSDEDTVNEVMGARPMRGAAWEQALACAQHYGTRGTLVCPSTVAQLKSWTDAGKPVMISWNPEGRDWSHASVVFDVVEDAEHGFLVHVADPNIPDPDETVRVVPKAEFYSKWYEKWPNYMVRRPAMMLEREVTSDGRQVMASRSLQHSTNSYADYIDIEKFIDVYFKDKPVSINRAKDRYLDFKYNFEGPLSLYIKSAPPLHKSSSIEDACWEDYEAVGMKDKDGEQVPNCVPVKKLSKIEGNPMSLPSASKVALRFAADKSEQMSKGILSKELRQSINKALIHNGLDGNGRFEKPEKAYSMAVDIIGDFGLQIDTVVSSHLFKARPNGTITVRVAFKNPEDSFSPIEIHNSVLYIQFTELRKDVFEAVAYMS